MEVLTLYYDSYPHGTGGLVGLNERGSISESYAIGLVQAGVGVPTGGLVGAADLGGSANTSYWDTQTTGQPTSAGGIGQTTAQLQSGTLPAGFDPAVWTATPGQYPMLIGVPGQQPLFTVHVETGGPLSTDGEPTSLHATATPTDGKTLQDEAVALGYLGFDWVQIVTAWPDPSTLPVRCLDASCDHTQAVTVPWSDPPQGGYPYCFDKFCGDSFPFYYPASAAEGNPDYCIHYLNHDLQAACLIRLQTDNALNFYDLPQGQPESFSHFLTELVGILPDDLPSDPLYKWTWEDNYHDGGGIILPSNYYSADPGGAGGITILSLDGMSVPEPPPITLLGWALFVFVFLVGGRSGDQIHS